VLLRQHRNRVGANLIGDISVGGDAVRADDYSADFSLPHHCA